MGHLCGVARLPWAIFVDARACFNAANDVMGNPSVSSSDWLIGTMRGSSEQVMRPTTRANWRAGKEATRRRKGPGASQAPQPPNANTRTTIKAATSAAGGNAIRAVTAACRDGHHPATQAAHCPRAIEASPVLQLPVLWKTFKPTMLIQAQW